jgi:hypothetical protein
MGIRMHIKNIQLACWYCDGVISGALQYILGKCKDNILCILMNSELAIFAYRTLLQSNQPNNLPLKQSIILLTGTFLSTYNKLQIIEALFVFKNLCFWLVSCYKKT